MFGLEWLLCCHWVVVIPNILKRLEADFGWIGPDFCDEPKSLLLWKSTTNRKIFEYIWTEKDLVVGIASRSFSLDVKARVCVGYNKGGEQIRLLLLTFDASFTTLDSIDYWDGFLLIQKLSRGVKRTDTSRASLSIWLLLSLFVKWVLKLPSCYMSARDARRSKAQLDGPREIQRRRKLQQQMFCDAANQPKGPWPSVPRRICFLVPWEGASKLAQLASAHGVVVFGQELVATFVSRYH